MSFEFPFSRGDGNLPEIIGVKNIIYAIGMAAPISVSAQFFGTNREPPHVILRHINSRYGLTPGGIIEGLGLKDVDYNRVSAYGHFGKAGLPWEA